MFEPGRPGDTKRSMLAITSTRIRISRSLRTVYLSCMVCLLVPGSPVKADSSSEEALRRRVDECYTALQRGDWKKVEKYLTKDSKPIYRGQIKKPLTAYRIDSIKIDPDGQTASVVVLVPLVSVTIPKPIFVPRTNVWRLVDHGWYLELPRAGADAQQWLANMAPPAVKPTPTPVALLSKDLKFDTLWRGIGVEEGGGTGVARYPFKNVSTHVVTFTDFHLGCDCLRLKTTQMEYKPGESGALEVEFDPSKLAVSGPQSFTQDIVIKTEPGGAFIKLTFAAIVTPKSAPSSGP